MKSYFNSFTTGQFIISMLQHCRSNMLLPITVIEHMNQFGSVQCHLLS